MDVTLLRGLVPTSKQDDKLGASAYEIDAIARTVVYTEFGNSLAHRLGIADIAER